MAEMENSKDLISVLWSGADILRSKMDANEYKNYLLGIIFYKYLSDSFLIKVYDMICDSKPQTLKEALDVLEMKDLKEGMILKGTVRNVIDFGVFVDIGVHQDGLVHISQITDRYIKHPLEAVSVGDVVDVKVMSVDMKKKRIQLTMRGIS